MGAIFDKLGEIMYLLPYLLLAAVVAVALVILVRSMNLNKSNTVAGKAVRAGLTVLALLVVIAIWYYFTPKELGEKKYSSFIRVASVICYLSALTDIWSNRDTEA